MLALLLVLFSTPSLAAVSVVVAIASSYTYTYVAVTLAYGALAGSIASMLVAGVISKALQKKASTPDISDVAQGILTNKHSNNNSIPVVYGSARIGGTICYMGFEGSGNKHYNIILGVAEGEIQFNNYYFNGEINDSLPTFIENKQGSDDQTACSLSGRSLNLGDEWDDTYKLSGTAYIYARLTYNNDKFPNGTPNITADVNHLHNLYDPRTSAYDGLSTNPALCIRDYLTSERYGRGIPFNEIDDTAIINMANYCDEIVNDSKRYEFNGVVDTSYGSKDNLEDMLSCCLGAVIFTGGLYKLIIDRPDVSVIDFNEDNIIGGWDISLENKQNRFNRIKINYINEEGKEDIATIDSEEFRVIDNGLILENSIDLKYINTSLKAKEIGTIMLNQSRQQIACAFTTTIKYAYAEVGDIITITHETTGWLDGKDFRITKIKILEKGEIEISCVEYDVTAYDTDNLVADDILKDTDYPDGSFVETPTDLIITDGLYETIGSSGVKSKINLSWTASDDVFVAGYSVEYKLSSDDEYMHLTTTANTNAVVFDALPEVYDFKICAFNTLSVNSEPLNYYNYTSYGLLTPPSDVDNLALQAVNGNAYMTWDKSIDLDVVVGGGIEFRHSKQGTGWQAGDILATSIAGNTTNIVLPLLQGTYYAKFIDTSGNYSTGTSSTVVTTVPNILNLNYVDELEQHPTWSGIKTNMIAVDDLLVLDYSNTIDDITANIDTISNWDSLDGGVSTSGVYEFDTIIDLSGVYTSKISKQIEFLTTNVVDNIDGRTSNIDTWASFDGDTPEVATALYIATTDDDPNASPTWSDWQLLTLQDVVTRGMKFRLEIASSSNNHQILIEKLSVTVDMPDVVKSGYNITSDGITNITYNSPFYTTPSLGVTAKDLDTDEKFTLTNQSKTGFTIEFNNGTGTIDKNFNYLAKGY